MISGRPILHWLLLAALVVVWGSSFMFTKIALTAFSPKQLVAARLGLAAVVLLLVLFGTGRTLPREGRQWRFFTIMAIVGNVIPFWLISWGQQGIDSGVAGILMAIMPLTTVLLAHFLVAGEPLNRYRAAGFVLGFSGILVLTGPEALLQLRGRGAAFVSELAVLAGAVCYAVNTIITRRRPSSDSLVASAGVLLISTGIAVPLAMQDGSLPIESPSWAPGFAVAFLGLVSTAFATVIYFKLITIAGPGFMSLTNYLIPLWAVAIGFVVMDEVPTWSALAALVLILAGIALSEGPGRRSRGSPKAVPPGPDRL